MKIEIKGKHVTLSSETVEERKEIMDLYFSFQGEEKKVIGVGSGNYVRKKNVKYKKLCKKCGLKFRNLILHDRGAHLGIKVGWHKTGINPMKSATYRAHPELIEE